MFMSQPAFNTYLDAHQSPNERYETPSYAFAILYLLVGYYVAYLGFFRRVSSAPASFHWLWNKFCTVTTWPIYKLIHIWAFSFKGQLSSARDRGNTHNYSQWSAYTITAILNWIFTCVSWRRLWILTQDHSLQGPPGLGNIDNSCYQNAVLQAIASLSTFEEFLVQSVPERRRNPIIDEIKKLIFALNEPSNAGRRLWTPRKLKSMSSWQQQDAQEYYSKIMEQMEKELKYSCPYGRLNGIEQISHTFDHMRHGSNIELQNHFGYLLSPSNASIDKSPIDHAFRRSPIDGLLAQRVGCSKCNFVEEISLIPFNCITVPLGTGSTYDLRDCLDEYTTLEIISEVNCIRCTLLQERNRLRKIIDAQLPNRPSSDVFAGDQNDLSKQLTEIQNAIDRSDFANDNILKRCKITEEKLVSTSKTRQAVIARRPRELVVHINRSIFDEVYGIQQKNYAKVRLSSNLDLNPWILGQSSDRSCADSTYEIWSADPNKSLLTNKGEIKDEGAHYCLRAVISHFGRHENGHYVCYRKYRRDHREQVHNEDFDVVEGKGDKSSYYSDWWRLSDDHISVANEAHVLNEGCAFMLFYEATGAQELQKNDTMTTKAENPYPE